MRVAGRNLKEWQIKPANQGHGTRVYSHNPSRNWDSLKFIQSRPRVVILSQGFLWRSGAFGRNPILKFLSQL